MYGGLFLSNQVVRRTGMLKLTRNRFLHGGLVCLMVLSMLASDASARIIRAKLPLYLNGTDRYGNSSPRLGYAGLAKC